jgi:transposase
MAKPHEIQKQFAALEPNIPLLTTLHKTHQQEYLRTRLKAIRLLWEGKPIKTVLAELETTRKSLITWMKTLIDHGVQKGLKQLVTPQKRQKPGKLSQAQQQHIIQIIEEQSPPDYGYIQYIFTGQILVELIERLWGIQVCDQTVYNLLDRQGFSYQRGHRDYENADPDQQHAYATRLAAQLNTPSPDEKHLFFDEFSVTNRPSTFYGWARKNTRVKVPSNESAKRKRINGFLAVDADTGKEYLAFSESSKTEAVGDFFHNLAQQVKAEGFPGMRITLDNNSTHKDKMRYYLWLKMRTTPGLEDFRVRFNNTPAYSPDFNVAEYVIHQLRLKLLHHLPANTPLTDITTRVLTYLETHQLHTKEQIARILQRILKLGGITCEI